MGKVLRVLSVEDSDDDALLVKRALEKGGYELEWERVETAEAMRSALGKKSWDLILSDYRLPQFSGMAALAILRETGMDLPFIIISGAIGEETAVEAMKAGANDYIMKGHLPRLVPAVERELQEAKVRQEHRKAQAELKANRAQLSNALEIAHLGHWEYDVSSDLFTFNDQFYKMLRTTVGEVGGYTMKSADYARRFVHPEDAELVGIETRKAIETQDPNFNRRIEHRMLYADGTVGDIAVRFFVAKDAQGRTVKTYGVNQDISEQKRVERALRESEERYRSLFDNSMDAILLTSPDGSILEANPAACTMFGRSQSDIKELGQSGLVDSSDRHLQLALKERALQGGEMAEITMVRANGEKFPAEISSKVFIDESGRQKTSMILRDMTEKRKAERNYQTLFQEMLNGFALHEIICDASGKPVNYRFLAVNPAFERLTGLKAEQIIGKTVLEALPDTERSWIEIYGRVALTGEPAFFEDYSRTMDKYFEITAFQPEPMRFACIFSDTTDRKKAVEALRQSEGKFRSLFDNAQEGIFQANKEGMYLTVNQAMAAMLGYDSPVDLMSTVNDIAHQLYVDPEDRSRLLKRIDERGSATGFECQFYKKDGSARWVSVDMHAVRDKAGGILHYEGFCEDITDRRLSFERLRKALCATIYAISAAVEARDPYTAGHQSRVADLAQAIATEIGLPADRIEGLRLAATIHDLGKLSVPAELLTKPKKLLDIEFNLIKIHSQAGYDILKDIEFPWPIARIVLEHHERMNGSGYPNGLVGDQILLESRIVAVADVVESMASYRPYRPALGIEAALDEIEKNK
ncbi:MAG: PAS domain S-box protein, partial [Spirochaetales bacterium]